MIYVYYRATDEEQWILDTNVKGEPMEHTLNTAIRAQRYRTRMEGMMTKRVVQNNELPIWLKE